MFQALINSRNSVDVSTLVDEYEVSVVLPIDARVVIMNRYFFANNAKTASLFTPVHSFTLLLAFHDLNTSSGSRIDFHSDNAEKRPSFP